jgi:hypothetical protein
LVSSKLATDPEYYIFSYLRHEISVRIGVFLSAAPQATCFAGALAYGITSGGDAGKIENWRLLFLVEGRPCILAGVMVFFVLPDSPEKARFLNEEDKLVARAREVRQVGDQEAHRVGGINFKDVGLALMDPKVCFTTSRRWNLKIPSYTSQNYPD